MPPPPPPPPPESSPASARRGGAREEKAESSSFSSKSSSPRTLFASTRSDPSRLSLTAHAAASAPIPASASHFSGWYSLSKTRLCPYVKPGAVNVGCDFGRPTKRPQWPSWYSPNAALGNTRNKQEVSSEAEASSLCLSNEVSFKPAFVSFRFRFNRASLDDASLFINRQKLMVSGSWWPFAPSGCAIDVINDRANFELIPITGHHVRCTNPSTPTQPVPLAWLTDPSPGMRQRFFQEDTTRSTCATTSTGADAKDFSSFWSSSSSPPSASSASSSRPRLKTLAGLSSPNTSTSRTRDSGVETVRNRNTSAQFPVKTTSSSTYHANVYSFFFASTRDDESSPPLASASFVASPRAF